MTLGRDLKAILNRNARAKVFGYSVIVYKLENGRLIADRVELGYGELRNILYIGIVFDKVGLYFDMPKEIDTIQLGKGIVETIHRFMPFEIQKCIRTKFHNKEGYHFEKTLPDMYERFDAEIMDWRIKKIITSTVQEYEKLKRNIFFNKLDLELHQAAVVYESRKGYGLLYRGLDKHLQFFEAFTSKVYKKYFKDIQYEVCKKAYPQNPEKYMYEKFFEIAWKVIDNTTKDTGDMFVFAGEFILEMLNYGETKFSELDKIWYERVIREEVVPLLSKINTEATSMENLMELVWLKTFSKDNKVEFSDGNRNVLDK